MSTVLIIGAGGVGNVVAHKCAANAETFSRVVLASRTLERCTAIQQAVSNRYQRVIDVEKLDADNVGETTAIIRAYKPRVVINVALPYQDLAIMDACLECGVDYLDTANYEPRDEAKFEYKWQWAYQDRYRERGIMALLGCGFDPGVTNIFCAHAMKHLFDEIDTIDILDCNAGDHGHSFATNFNPEINIREITQRGRFWERGEWKETEPLAEKMTFDFPEVGPKTAYLLYHEELESLIRHVPGLQRIRFWMTFGDEYLTHLRVLQNVGLTSIEPVQFAGQEIVPIQFLKALLPDPASLAPGYTGKTCIGCLVEGRKNGKPKRAFVYNVCDHQAAYAEVGSQAISYTTGVPATVGAMMMVSEQWKQAGVVHVEQLDPDPFLQTLAKQGLPWHVKEY